MNKHNLQSQLALLRGINVGGKNKLPMKDLRELFVAVGCTSVRTFIQSGNVLFVAPAEESVSLESVISAKIEERFSLRVPVVTRTLEEMEKVVSSNPFLAEGESEDQCFVMFLAHWPAPERIALLDPERSPSDRFLVRGRDIYLHIQTGAADSKLTNAYFDSKLKTISTSRNWRTVTKLLEMMREDPADGA